VPELRAKADMVIAATHMGHYSDGRRGVNAPGDVEMARAVKGLDLIVGGHSQNPVCMLGENRRNDAYQPGSPVRPTARTAPGSCRPTSGASMSAAPTSRSTPARSELLRYQLLPVNLASAPSTASGSLHRRGDRPRTPAVRPSCAPSRTPARRGCRCRWARPPKACSTATACACARQPTTLGQLIARAMMERTGADLALMNSGGVRDSLPAGRITYRDVLKVQPFGNQLSLVRLKGSRAAGVPARGGEDDAGLRRLPADRRRARW
jgi:5'-nucleotidase/UDP-sugar diphosphatase